MFVQSLQPVLYPHVCIKGSVKERLFIGSVRFDLTLYAGCTSCEYVLGKILSPNVDCVSRPVNVIWYVKVVVVQFSYFNYSNYVTKYWVSIFVYN